MHRRPGDGSTLSQMEQPFPITQQWVQAEAQTPAGAHAGLGNGSDAGGDGHSFTRVVIGELKPDVLQQLADAEKGAQVCRWAVAVAWQPSLPSPARVSIRLAGTYNRAAPDISESWTGSRQQCCMHCRFLAQKSEGHALQGLGTSLSLLSPWRTGQSPARR